MIGVPGLRPPRPRARYTALLAAAAVAMTPVPASRLNAQAEPPRPGLAGIWSDTTAAESYLAFGIAMLGQNPARAADAFYWASRLDPADPDALLLRWHALWLAEPKRFKKYLRGDEKVLRSPETWRIDSLRYRALLRDPFALTRPSLPGARTPGVREVRGAIERRPNDVGLRILQAGNFYTARQYDSVVVQLTHALGVLRELEAQSVRPLYVSKEIFEYGIAKALVAKGDLNAARAAFGRALAENLSFSPAHAGIGSIAWSNWQDVETAVQEYDLAVQLAPADGLLRYQYGAMLAEAKRLDEAVDQLETAIRLEPHFAEPYYVLADVHERRGSVTDAMLRYRQFLDRAPPKRIDWAALARGRLDVLGRCASAAGAGEPRVAGAPIPCSSSTPTSTPPAPPAERP